MRYELATFVGVKLLHELDEKRSRGCWLGSISCQIGLQLLRGIAALQPNSTPGNGLPQNDTREAPPSSVVSAWSVGPTWLSSVGAPNKVSASDRPLSVHIILSTSTSLPLLLVFLDPSYHVLTPFTAITLSSYCSYEQSPCYPRASSPPLRRSPLTTTLKFAPSSTSCLARLTKS